MNSGKYLIFFAVICTFLTSFWTTPVLAVQELIPFNTPPAGGGAYVLGAGMVSVANKYMPGGVKFVHEASTGTMEMIRRLQTAYNQKKDSLATFGVTDGTNAYLGKQEYVGKAFPGLRAIVFNQYVDLYLAVPAKSPIKSYADVKGKRIGMGGAGSSVANTGFLILEQYGVTKKDFKPFYYVYKETIEGIGDGSLDGGFLAGGYPMASYMELSTTQDVRIIPVDENIAKKITTDYPGYYENIVKAKLYRGLEQDTRIVGWTGAVWTHANTNTDVVYNFLKTLFDHKEEYYTIHRDAKALTVETATKTIRIPLHPGAEKCLRELGAIK